MTTSETERIVLAEENYKKDPLYIPITELEQSAFCQTENNLITKPLKEELQSTWINWQKIPEAYQGLDANELDKRILKSKSAYFLCILQRSICFFEILIFVRSVFIKIAMF